MENLGENRSLREQVTGADSLKSRAVEECMYKCFWTVMTEWTTVRKRSFGIPVSGERGKGVREVAEFEDLGVVFGEDH